MRTIFAIAFLLAATPVANAMSGAEVSRIYVECTKAAEKQCKRNTKYCQAYRRGFVKMCLVENEVPADIIIVLMN